MAEKRDNKVHAGDFVELDFIARIKGNNKIFDLTKKDVAKKEGIFQENRKYKPLIVCLGSGHLLKGLDKALEGKEVGKTYEVEVLPEEGFGKRNPKLIQISTLKQFKDKGISPVPGMQLAIDGALATIRSVSGGRVIIDFNHPLAGRTLLYTVSINRKITDTDEKISAIISLLTELEPKDYSINLSNNKQITIILKKDTPKSLLDIIKRQISNLIPETKDKEIKIQINKK